MERKCRECKGPISGDKRKIYCGRSCAGTANNRGTVRNGTAWPKCLGCEKKANPGNGRRGYCTASCRQADEEKRWIAGELDGCWKYTHAAYVQRYLERRSNLVCEIPGCGESRTRPNGKHILQVDHIDGNWRNNRPENLRLICPTCHALTETYGAANKGKGRTWKANYHQFIPKSELVVE